MVEEGACFEDDFPVAARPPPMVELAMIGAAVASADDEMVLTTDGSAETSAELTSASEEIEESDAIVETRVPETAISVADGTMLLLIALDSSKPVEEASASVAVDDVGESRTGP